MFGPSSPSSQPLPLRLSIVGQNNNNNNNNNTPSQKKKRKSLSLTTTSITGHPSHSLDEENRLQTPINMINNGKAFDSNLLLLSESDHHNNKSPRIEQIGDTTDDTFEHIEVDISESSLDHTIEKITSTTTAINNDNNMKPTRSSDCGTDMSSVSERREWLKSFEKQQTNNPFRSTSEETGSLKSQTRDNDNGSHDEARDTGKESRRQSPPHSTKTINRTNNNGYSNSSIRVNSTSIATVTKQRTSAINQQRAPLINRRASSGVTWSGVNKEEVKATDDSHASVASLSKWLASDPTSAKKKRHVRRGRNIISKSRQFEKDLKNVVIMEESKIARGAVGDRKKWLQSAFRSSVEEDRDEDDASSTYSGYVQSDVGISARSYSNSNYNRQCAQTEIVTNDAASSLSVADKKDWLKEAFSKKSQERTRLGGYARAQTDVMHNRGQPRDEVASRAKMRFKERSARKLLETSSTTSLKATKTTNSKEPITDLASTSSIGRVSTSRIEPRPRGENITISPDNTNMKLESNNNTYNKETVFRPKKVVQIADSVEEDNTPVDFRAAREALVQRGKKNGHNTQVVNKVYLRKQKFEKLEEESRRKSMGRVLKPSWDIGDPSRGGPSTVYEKNYVQDIAPKKSFEELP
jgi:hypothetical protein